MKERFLIYAGHFLFALNFFILFILLFENKLEVPLWLQPVGRMHLLFLHFPIVLLLLSMALEILNLKSSYRSNPFFKDFTSILLLIGILSAGVTVIMGLFLSREGGYSPDVLSYHKWSGVSVFFIGSLLYFFRNQTQYKGFIIISAATVSTICLILAGHFGATLTHGDSFIWKPIINQSPEKVPIEQAMVFDHIIKPIFDSKCTKCHNPDKLKGKLILTDSVTILKGGKSGEALVAGNPGNSLLLKRIHLPLEVKKHMPPSGNTQLTPDEMELLYLWIKGKALFNQRITALPLTDSLRIQALAFLNANETQDEPFDFAAADEETVDMLNTNYRVVSSVAKESPALSVNIYNKNTYTSETLTELLEIKYQIISLNLSKMPVTNNDLINVAKFENLKTLNLNFSDITGEGLAKLTSLKHLKSLSIAGTKVSFEALKQYIPEFENLRTIALWKTELSKGEVNQLQKENSDIQFLTGRDDADEIMIKLNPPRLKQKSVVFNDSILLPLFHAVNGVKIRFTIDGSDPDSTSTLFDGKTVLKETTSIKARAYKSGWLTSDVATLPVYRSFIKPDSTMLLSRLSRVHPANGANTFFDHQLGTFNANSPAWANNWAGFRNNDMELLLEFKAPKTISSIAINTLVETETSIFPPSTIEIWGGSSPTNLQLIKRMNPELPKEYRKPFIQLIECKIPQHQVEYLKIIAKPTMKLPAWHKNKDNSALLLIDEIFIN